MANSARGIVGSATEQMETLSPSTFIYFGLIAGTGAVLLTLSFFFLPLIVLAPQKFAFLFSLGSMFVLASLIWLRGTKAFLAHVLASDKVAVSTSYALSLCLTMYFVFFRPTYLFVLLFSVFQMFCLVALIASYIPGGTTALNFIRDVVIQFFQNLIRRG
eukprot:GHVU01205612.1.p1 GENE.GHVU01205612.1~~GHVU01205612.1.p1  ORF type:complete len:173 (-),score=31.82 GHVU01205612.1:191-670(-)